MSDPDPPDDDAGASGAIDVAMSDARLPRVGDPGASGSIDVRLTEPEGAPAQAVGEPDDPSEGSDRTEKGGGKERAGRRRAGTLPASGARVPSPEEPAEPTRVQRVGRWGVHAADAIGDTVVRAGEAVGDVVGASLSHLPVVPKTRRGRVMARSVIVSFLLVFGWIAVIVGLQLRGTRPPDLRPDAERILIALRDGKAVAVYDDASERFQGVVRDRQTFVDQMTEMNKTLGRFIEIGAVIRTETGHGPGGKTGRLDMSLQYEKAKTRGSVSFRWEDHRWKLLGLAIEVPDAIASNKEQRKERIAPRPDEIAELKAAVEGVLVHSAKGEIDQLWQEASPAFQQAIPVDDLRRTETKRRATLGAFDRVLDVRGVRLNPGRNYATLVVLLQYDNATITGNFEFSRSDDKWRLVIYKLIMPILQAEPAGGATTGATTGATGVAPDDAGATAVPLDAAAPPAD